MRQHADLLAIRKAVLDALPPGAAEAGRMRRWLRRLPTGESGEHEEGTEQTVLSATPAGDTTLSEAARLAGAQPVGSHHLLLAALADADSAAARALVALGVDLDQAKEALRGVDVTGTSDESPEEAGRRQMVIRVTDERLTVEATDRVLIKAAWEAVKVLGDAADPPGTIRGDLPASASLSGAWQALRDSLEAIARRAASPASPTSPASSAGSPSSDEPGSEIA
jgi:ATP-dependent Clp protease ATP-binding subunit ClpC